MKNILSTKEISLIIHSYFDKNNRIDLHGIQQKILNGRSKKLQLDS